MKFYLNQISKQIFLVKNLNKELFKEDFDNEQLEIFLKNKISFDTKTKTGLIGSIYKRELKSQEKLLFFNNYNLNFLDALISAKYIINNKIFHSKSYSRRGNCNSYSISYVEKNIKKYAEIEYFIELNNKCYAYITKFNLKANPEKFLPPSTGFFYEIVKKHIFNYYKIIEISNSTDIIECDLIKNRCIVVNNKEFFITELEYEFEHD